MYIRYQTDILYSHDLLAQPEFKPSILSTYNPKLESGISISQFSLYLKLNEFADHLRDPWPTIIGRRIMWLAAEDQTGPAEVGFLFIAIYKSSRYCTTLYHHRFCSCSYVGMSSTHKHAACPGDTYLALLGNSPLALSGWSYGPCTYCDKKLL